MDNIISREYVATVKKHLVPTDTGCLVVDSLAEKFQFIELGYTRQVEQDLDRIAQGEASYTTIIQGVHENLNREIDAHRLAVVPKHPCPACGKALNRMKGKTGYFWGCSGYKDGCKQTYPNLNGEWRRFPLPRAEIKDILCTSRPFFGKGGLMSLKGPTRTQYAGILAIQDYPSNTFPGILNGLLSLPFEWVLTQSFTFLSKANAQGRMSRQQARMVNAGDVAESQIADISAALDDLISNRFVMGAHSLSLLIYAEDPITLCSTKTLARPSA